MSLASLSSPLTTLSKSLILSLLGRLRVGQLTILSPVDKVLYIFPESASVPDKDRLVEGESSNVKAKVTVIRETFWLRLAFGGDIGLSEAYMFGDIDCDDLTSLFKLYIYNRPYLGTFSTVLRQLILLPTKIIPLKHLTFLSGFSTSALEHARKDIAAHYDLSYEMFKAFLGPDMTYSCAIFPENDGNVVPYHTQTVKESASTHDCACPVSLRDAFSYDPLAEAQHRKLSHIEHLLKIPPSSSHKGPFRVLEIGSGWGSLSVHLVLKYPHVEIDTLTLSTSQCDHVNKLAKELKIEDRIHVHLLDYHAIPAEWAGSFHRAVAIEMVEHVKPEALTDFFSTMRMALHPRVGVLVLQATTIALTRIPTYDASRDFIQQYIFPGSCIPAVESLLMIGGQQGLCTERVESIGRHYPRTLREWKRRFFDACESGLGMPKQEESQDWSLEGERGEIFRRKWNYYFCYCEAGFLMKQLDVHIVSYRVEGNTEYNLPLTG